MQTNRTVENIGARRLHTVIERIVEEISFDAPDKAGIAFSIDEVLHCTHFVHQQWTREFDRRYIVSLSHSPHFVHVCSQSGVREKENRRSFTEGRHAKIHIVKPVEQIYETVKQTN
jgi:hypothetical protein